jgi:hypothetical protein
MHTLWVLVLWFGFDTGSGAAGAMQTVGYFPNNSECMSALTPISMSSSNLIHGVCVAVVVPK